jgi:predicted Rossmann fold nucleotide-binding protein DprA/Smf involved in DNA uptake
VMLSERGALLVFLREASGGWSAAADAVEAEGSALQALGAWRSGQQELFVSDRPLDVAVEAAEEDIRQWEAEGFRFLTLLDDDFPEQLLTIHQRPPFLMTQGMLDRTDARGVAVVGTRSATPHGLAQARDLAAGLAERQVPVISGLAAGIDTAAHTGALEVGGRTVADILEGERGASAANRARGTDRVPVPAGRPVYQVNLPNAKCNHERLRGRHRRCRGVLEVGSEDAGASGAAARQGCDSPKHPHAA